MDEKTQAALSELMDEHEAKALNALVHFRFQEFGHQAELWASLHKISGQKRTNPFQPVATLGRQMARDFHTGKK